jgi:hypothetical protein
MGKLKRETGGKSPVKIITKDNNNTTSPSANQTDRRYDAPKS